MAAIYSKYIKGGLSLKEASDILNQRTNGPVNAHLISGPSISI